MLISNRNGECHTSSEAAAGRVQRGVKKNNKIIIGVWTANDDDSQHNVTKIKIYNISQTFQVFSFSPLFPAPPIYFLSRSTPILSRPRFLLNPNPEMADFMCRTRARESSAKACKQRTQNIGSFGSLAVQSWVAEVGRARFWVQQNNSAETFSTRRHQKLILIIHFRHIKRRQSRFLDITDRTFFSDELVQGLHFVF